MVASWTLEVDDKVVATSKAYVPDTLMSIFQPEDYFSHGVLGESRPVAEEGVELGYKTRVGVIHSRLSLMGIEARHVRAEFVSVIRTELSSMEPHYTEELLAGGSSDPAALLKRMLTQYFHRYSGEREEESIRLEMLWEEYIERLDIREFVALVLSEFPHDLECRLDLTELYFGGWIEKSDDLVRRANSSLLLEVSTSGKIIVISEGSTDAEFLQAILAIHYPGLYGYFSFLDFSGFSAPGGTDRAVGLAKGLAAASVMNRVVVILDNDAAGKEAENLLAAAKLPRSFAVRRLPDQEYAQTYPTTGPGGNTLEDVNGRACSIEMMFGKDLLCDDSTGTLHVVHWKARNPRVGCWQGEVENKGATQRRIRSLIQDSQAWPESAIEASRKVADTLVMAAKDTAVK